MNPNDIRIRQVYIREVGAPGIIDDSTAALAPPGTYELVVEWEAGATLNAVPTALHLTVATRDIFTNAMVGALTFIDVATVITNGNPASWRYEYIRGIMPGNLIADHMYEVSACLVHNAIPLHSHAHSFIFVAY